MGRRPISWWPKPFIPKDICGISPGFPGLFPAKRYVIYVLLTRSPLEPKFALDLHVLSPPLAFALSQDQTLQLKTGWFDSSNTLLIQQSCYLFFKDRSGRVLSDCPLEAPAF